MVDAELDRAAQDGAGGVGVARRAEHAGAGELHRAEADAVDGLVAEVRGLSHGRQPPLASTAATRRGIDPGTRTTTHPPRGARRVPAPRTASSTSPESVGPGGRRPAAHAGPAARGGLAARRGRAVLVHVARAGPRHHAVGERPRRARAGPRPRSRPSARTSSTSPASPCRPPTGAYPTRGAAGAAADRRRARAEPGLPARPAHRRPGLERARDAHARHAHRSAPDGAAEPALVDVHRRRATARPAGRRPPATRSRASAPSTRAATTTRPSPR